MVRGDSAVRVAHQAECAPVKQKTAAPGCVSGPGALDGTLAMSRPVGRGGCDSSETVGGQLALSPARDGKDPSFFR
jgi:hypothetical protein